MIVNGFELIGDWKVSNVGKIALANKGGKKYFLKSYGQYKLPRKEDVTEKTFCDMSAKFNAFKRYRIKLNTALASFAGSGGNVLLPQSWFVSDINYIEATEFVNDVISDSEIVKLPKEDLLFIMKTAAAALNNVHKKNIVHSDLKLSNVLVAKSSMGKLVAKIIDFDRSYFADEIRPNDIGGDQAFMSPELTLCFITDMADESIALLSTKTDVFSLGIVFHLYLTGGEYPQIIQPKDEEGEDMELSFCGEAVLQGGKLKISSKIKDGYLASIIGAMIQLQPEDRPDAFTVLCALRDKKPLPLPENSTVVLPYEIKEEKEEKEEKPAVKVSEKEESIPKGFCEPWEEHKIVFDTENLKRADFVSSERFESGTIKCYKIYNSKGVARIFNANTLKLMGLANPICLTDTKEPVVVKKEDFAPEKTTTVPKKTEPTPEKTPDVTKEEATKSKESGEEPMWGADRNYEFDIEAIKEAGYVGCEKMISGTIECYALIMADGSKKRVSMSVLKIMKLVKLKSR